MRQQNIGDAQNMGRLLRRTAGIVCSQLRGKPVCAEAAELKGVGLPKLFGTKIITLQALDAGHGAVGFGAFLCWVLLWCDFSLLCPDFSF